MTRLRRLLSRVRRSVLAASLTWLTTTAGGEAVMLALALVFGLLGIMGLRVFAPAR